MSAGKKIFAGKKEPVVPNPNDMYSSALEIDPHLREELNKAGLVARWINATEFRKQFGFHRSRWVPYKRPGAVKPSADSLYGGDPEGFIRRGDLVLAVKTKDENKRHADALKSKANLYKDHNKQHAAELRKAAKQAGFETEVVDGFGADDSDEDSE